MTGPRLPDAFLRVPLAHRALHDVATACPENSLAAVRAAVEAGYGIEIDLQPGAAGAALVFHDYGLERMTDAQGPVSALSAAAAAATPLKGGTGAGIPTLEAVLEAVAGRVPVLVEIKDQSVKGAPGIGPLEAAVVRALAGYAGPVAVMSFNPDSVAEMARLAPELPRGLTTCAWDDPADVAGMDPARIAALRAIDDFDRVGAGFISHDAADLGSPPVRRLKEAGVPVLCWTVRSAAEEAVARRVADNVTFEGYAAVFPA